MPDLDWSALLREFTEQGAAFAARAVCQPFRGQLAAELSSGPYEPVIGQVRQEAESFVVGAGELDRYPVLGYLCDELAGQVHEHLVGGPTSTRRTSIGVRMDTA